MQSSKEMKTLPWSSEMDRKLSDVQKDPQRYFRNARQGNSTGIIRKICGFRKASAR